MAQMTAKQFCDRLKYLAMKRASQYSDKYPYNCLYIHSNYISADCIGLVKSLINDPLVYNKTSPVGYFVKPNQVISDMKVVGILNTCSNVSKNFSQIRAGEFLAMLGSNGNKHAGVFVGEFNDGGICNTVEACCDWGANKITTSYTAPDGSRFDHKGGTKAPSSWDYHGMLTDYITYESIPDDPPYVWEKVWVLRNTDGELVKGWVELKKKWYYLDKNGIMLTGWQKLKWSKGIDWFYFDSNGAMVTDWQKLKWSGGTDWFYFDINGAMVTGWLDYKNKKYYLDPKTGAMVTGTVKIDGKTYKFDSNGALIS